MKIIKWTPGSVAAAAGMFILLGAAVSAADEAAIIFDLSTVNVYRITFESANFWQELLNNAETETPLECTVQWNDITLTGCGMRIKGNSSQRVNSEKKPFKLEFDEFKAGQRLYGLEHVNFNNCYKDPTFIREVLAYELFSRVGKVPRANFVHLYLNGEDWGLYVQVEEVEEPWLTEQFGSDEGNLYKGDPNGTLELQPDFRSYTNKYELKSDIGQGEWIDLTNFIKVLNTTATAVLPAQMDRRLDAYNFLRTYAVNNFLSSLDSYWGTGHNYYLYNEPGYDRFSYIIWDVNEAFGNFQFGKTAAQMLALSYTYVTDPSHRPLATKLLATEAYGGLYISLYKDLLDQYLTTNLITRIRELHDFVRPYVYADPKRLYSTSQFEANLTQHIFVDGITSVALENFPTDRRDYLLGQLQNLGADSPVRINELMAWNTGAYISESGETPDWIELYNGSEEEIDLSDYYLSDNSTNLMCWQFPEDTLIEPYDYLVITAEGIATSGVLIAKFSLDKDGERIYLSRDDTGGLRIVDGIYFDEQTANSSYGRETDGNVFWSIQSEATPGTANISGGNIAPVAKDLMISPVNPRPDESVHIYVTITDDSSISSAWCFTKIDEVDSVHPLSLMGENVYTGLLPGKVEGTEVSYWIIARDDGGKNVRLPATGSETYTVTAQSRSLVINELMAINDSTISDGNGDYDDWIELYNYGTSAVEMTGMYLSDNLGNPTKWQFPEVMLPAGAFLLLWADDEVSQGEYHVPFKLSGDGEEIGLYDTDAGGTVLIHSVVYGVQSADISYGIYPDATGNWEEMMESTPGTHNTLPEPGMVIGMIVVILGVFRGKGERKQQERGM